MRASDLLGEFRFLTLVLAAMLMTTIRTAAPGSGAAFQGVFADLSPRREKDDAEVKIPPCCPAGSLIY